VKKQREFNEATERYKSIKKEDYENAQSYGEVLSEALFSQIESGVVLLISAYSFLESELYRYALEYVHPDYWDDHFDSLRTLSKWLVIPKQCEGKEIDETCREINQLRELIGARNAIIHHKVSKITSKKKIENLNAERKRFERACATAQRTVEELLELIKK